MRIRADSHARGARLLSQGRLEYPCGASARLPRRVARAKLHFKRRNGNGRVRNANGARARRRRRSSLRETYHRRKRNGGRAVKPSFRTFRRADSKGDAAHRKRRLRFAKTRRNGRAYLSKNHARASENKFFRLRPRNRKSNPRHESRACRVCVSPRRGSQYLRRRGDSRSRACRRTETSKMRRSAYR